MANGCADSASIPSVASRHGVEMERGGSIILVAFILLQGRVVRLQLLHPSRHASAMLSLTQVSYLSMQRHQH